MGNENFSHVEAEIRRTIVLLEAATDIQARKALLRKMKELLDQADRILSASGEQPKPNASSGGAIESPANPPAHSVPKQRS
jgi:hypothetical protein